MAVFPVIPARAREVLLSARTGIALVLTRAAGFVGRRGRVSKALNCGVIGRRVLLQSIGIALVLVAMSTAAAAATRTWNGGGGNNNWTTGANWVGGVAPVAGDSVIFDATGVGVRPAPNNDLAAGTSFGTITVSVGGYTIGGNSVSLTTGLTASNAAGSSTVSLVVDGAGTLTKSGAGTLILSGANTYTGATTISAGVVNIQNATALGTVAGGVSVTSGARLELQGTIAVGAEALTLNGTGGGTGALLNVSGTNSWAGAITLGSASTIGSTVGTLTVTGGVTNGGFLLTVTGAGDTTFSTTAISGTGGLTKSGIGTLTLTGANTYTGATTISAGVVNIQNATAFGTVAGGVSVTSGARLELQGTIAVGAEALTLNGTGGGNGALLNVSGTNSWAGAITLGSASTIGSTAGTLTGTGGVINGGFLLTVTGAGDTTFSTTAISGTGGLTMSGSGTLTLTRANTYTGATTISAGVVNIQNATALGTTAAGTSVTSGARLELQGTIAVGAEALTLNGTGGATGAMLNVSGTNSWAGAITLGSASTIGSTAGTLTGTGGVINGGFLLTVAGAGNTTFSTAAISGTGGLTMSGSGTLTLSFNNTYTGATTINSGVVSIAADARLGTAPGGATPGHLTFGGGTLATTATFTLNSNRGIAFTSTGTIDVAAATTLTYGGIAAGAGGLTKTSAGTLILSGASTFAGATTINAGVVSIAADNNLGAAPGGATPGQLTFGGGTLATTATFTLNSNRGIAFTSTGTLDVAAATTLTYGGIAAGAGGLTKTSTGTLILSGASTYAGATTINAGVINIQNASALGTGAGGASVTSPARLELQGNIAVGAEALTLNGTGGGNGALLNVSGTNSWAGAITLGSASTIGSTAGTLTGTGGITNGGFLLTVAGAGSTTFSTTAISGTGGLTKTGNGTLTLTGANTYTGATTISAGVVNIQNDTALGTVAGGVSVTSGARLELQGTIAVGAEALTLNGTGGGTGALLNVSGTNSWAGAITLGSASTIGSTAGTLTGTGGVTNGGFLLTVTGAGDATFSTTAISGTGGLTKSGNGTLTLTGANTYTGATTISAGVVNIQNATALGTVAGGVSVTSGARLELQGTIAVGAEALTLNGTGGGNGALLNVSGTNSWAGAITLGSASTIGSTAGTLTGTGGVINGGFLLTVTGAGDTTFSTTAISGTGGLTMSGSGTLTLTRANTYTGATTISAGVVNIQNATALGTTAAGTSVTSGARLELQGTIAVGAEALTLNGTGGATGAMLNVSGTNSWAGAITLGSASTIGSMAGTLTGSGGVTNGGFLLTVAGAGNTTFSTAAISGTGGLTMSGSGTLTLSFNNTYTGATTINSGVVSIAADARLGTAPGGATPGHLTFGGGTLATTATFTLNSNRGIAFTSTGTIDVAAATTLTYGGIAAGAGGLTKTSAGTLILSGASTFAGATTINAGVVSIAADNNLGAAPGGATPGQLTFGGGTLATTATFTLNSNRGIAFTSTGTLDVAAATTLTYGGIAAGAGGLTKISTGTLILSGASTYAGATTINAGVVRIAADNNLGAAPGGATAGQLTFGGGTLATTATFTLNSNRGIAFASTGTIDVAATTTLTYGGIAAGAGGLTKTSTGTLILSGASTYTGATAISAGVISIQNSTALGTAAGGVSVTSGARLELQGTIAVGAEALALNGTGGGTGAMLNVSGSNSWAGAITLGSATTIGSATGTLTGTGGVTNGGFLLTVAGAGNTAFSITAISGTGGLTMSGSGTLTLSAASTYSGATTINSGRVTVSNVSGSAMGTSTVSVAASGTLSGSGAFSGAVTLNGTVDPGDSPGTLSTGAETWGSGGQYTWQISQANGTKGDIPGWDWLNGSGAINVTATSGSPFTIHLTSLDLANNPGQTANFSNTQSYSWPIATGSGGISGFAANKFVLDASGFQNSLNGGTFSVAQSGNDINLTFGPSATTIADGTNPGNVTLAPGDAATEVDAFTFVTDVGTDTITAVNVSLAAGTSGGSSLVEITNDAGTVVYGSVANPASDTPVITLTTNITVTTTVTQYKIRITPKSHAAMPAPPGSTYSVTAFISNWTGTKAHAGTDAGSATLVFDNFSPGDVTAATATPGNTQVSLTWTNPGDSDLASIIVLRFTAAVADAPAEGATYVVGDTINLPTVACVVISPSHSCTDTGLTNGTAYHYKIFARDNRGNYSTGVVPAGSPATAYVTTVTNVTSSTTNGTYGVGATVSIQATFSQAVTVTGTPQLTLETGTTDAVVNYASGSGTSTLTFTYAVAAGHTSADLDYIGTTALALNGGTILDGLGNAAALTLPAPGAAGSLGANKALVIDGTAPAVTNVTSSTADGTYGVGAAISIQVAFSETVTVTGTPQLTLETGTTDAVVNYASGSGTSTLTFTYTVAAGHTSADLDYVATTSLALNGGTIQDAGLNNATLTLAAPGAAGSLGANKALVIDTAAPTVTNVTSSTADGTYGVGAAISIQVTFSETVTVTGTPQLTLETGTTDAVVNYASGSGTSTLTFTYTVAAGHTSADLDYVATTSLALNGGTIQDAGLNNATLTLAAPGAAGSLGANKALVIDTAAPTVTNVTSSTADGTYGVGAAISIQVTFSETVTVTGTPQLTLETGTTDAVVNYASGSGTSTLTFTYTVAAGHTSADLDYVATTSLALNGGTIRDAGLNNATLTLASPGAAGSLGANKALVIDTTAPTVTNVTSSATDGTYGVGAAIAVTVTFSEPVTVTGTPQLTLETGTTDAVVDYASGSGTSTLTLTYTVAAGHTSADLDYVATTSLALNGGTIRDAGLNSATLTLASPGAAGSLGANKALVIDTTVPTVTNVTSSTADGTYGVGAVVSIQVAFSEAVTVTGTPQLTLETGTTDAVVNYASGSGTSTLTFTYTVAAGHTSADLDYVATTSLALNGGTIRDAGLNNATLTLASPGAAGSLGANKALVIDTAVPTVTNVTSSTADGTYGVGAAISIQVAFSETVTVTGIPQLTLETGTTDAAVNYSGGSGTSTLTFTYTVVAGDTSADLDYVGTTALALNGGTIRDAGLNNATLTLAAPGAAGSLGAGKALVIDTTAPTVTNVTSSTADGTYGVGAAIAVTVTFNEPVTVTGTPQLTLETGTTDAVVNYASGSGTSTLTFTYTVAAGDTSADLDYVATTSLALNSGTIRDAGSNNATLTLAAPGAAGSLGANKALVIDTTAATVTNVTSSTADGTYGVGAAISVQVTFSEAVIVTGTPQLTLETGATDAVVNYASGNGTATLTFNYTVAAGHTSADLDYVGTTSLAPNGGTIRDAGLNNATLTLAAPGAAGSLGANKALVVDGTEPAVINVTSSTPDGTYGVGTTIAVQVTFSEAVNVTGTPQLMLETGTTDAVVNYASGSGTATLTFNYTVAAGHTSADLDYVATTSLAPNGGTIRDAGSNNATLTLAAPGTAGSLGANKALVIDGSAPTVTNVTSSTADGTYGVGATIAVTVSFSEAVNVTGTPQLTLETGATDAVVNYSSGSGTSTLTFNYTVAAGHTSSDLDYVSAALAPNGGTIRDAGSNDAVLTLASPGAAGSLGANKALVIDTTAPTVTAVTSSTADGTYGAGATIAVTVTFNEPVTVTGTPQLTLETGATDAVVNYSSGSGTATLTFNYTVAAGHTSSDLDYVGTTSLAPNGGTIRDAGSNNATLTLASPGAAGSLGANKALVIDTASPTVTAVTSSTADGTYGAGATIAVTVTFNESVTVTGTPQLTLETGTTDAVVNYASGSGTATLTFNYTVAAGHTSADLDYVATTSLAPNGGTIRDAGLNNATLTLASPGAAGSLGANKALVIDGTAPTVTNVTSSTADGTYGVGATIAVTVSFSEAAIVTGTPQLTLETGATDAVVNYASGSGTSTLTFNYTVAAGHTSADLDYVATTSLALNSGTIRDAGSNNATLTLAAPGAAGSLGANKNLIIDTAAPTVTNVTSSTADGTYGVGATIAVTVTFSEAVIVTGTPQLTLETGATDAVVNYSSGSGTSTLTFNYTVAAGNTTADLDYVSTAALALNGGTIQDAVNNSATLTLAAPGAAGSLGANKALVIDTAAPTVTNVSSSTADGTYGVGATIAVTVTFSEAVIVTGTPQLTLETGATDTVVNYTSGSGTPTLTFSYSVAAGHTSADLDYVSTAALALNGGTIRDAVNNNATLTLAAPGTAGSLGANKALVIDTTAPTVTNVTSSTADGTYGVGATIAVTVTFNEAVTITGTPQLTLETGATDAVVNYSSGSGTPTLTFNYTVAAGHTTADLDYVATTSLALNGGTIRDAGLNNATLTLAAPGAAGSLGANKALVIDTTIPVVTNVTSSTPDGLYGAGAAISIQVTFSEAVTVTGTPQLTLETGATDAVVNYASGSGTSTLTFVYTVAAGHTSADLDYVSTAALALSGGTIRDAGSNNAALTLAAPGAAGSLGANKALVVDGNVPTVTGVTSSTANGTYGTGATIAIQVNFNEAVTVTGAPQLTLETGTTDAVVNYASGSGTTTLTFSYTVAAGHNSADLDYVATTSLALNGGTIRDAGSNNANLTLPTPGVAGSLGANKNLVIDAIAPTVTNVTSSTADGTYGVGAAVSVQVTFSEAVTVVGTPQLTLETGTTDAVVNYASGSGTSTLTFTYTVAAGDTTGDLDYASSAALALNGGTIQDAVNNNATLTLAAPGSAGSLGTNKALVIDTTSPIVTNVSSSTVDGTYGVGSAIAVTVTFNEAVLVTGTPQLTLETGATDAVVNYLSGSGTSTLTFNYTVAAGHITGDLDYVATTALALNGGTIRDAGLNNAMLTLSAPGAAGSLGANKNLIIDTTAPTVTNVTSSTPNGTFGAGTTISIQITFSEAVVVTGTPQLTLETGATDAVVNYAGGSGSSTLTFNYTVAVGHTSADLDYVGINALALNGGTIRDAGSNNATLTLPAPGAAGSLGANSSIVVVPLAPAVTVTPTTGLITTEAGGTATFTMVLTSQPMQDVTIPLNSSNTTEGTVAPASVMFTSANWNVPQTVTITGVDDAIADGAVAYTIVTATTSSSDPTFNGLTVADVSVSNTDNDAPGVTVTPISGLVTTEAGGIATFTVILTSQPTGDVTIPLSSSDPTEGTVAPALLTFTAANWNVAQTVTIAGVDDALVDGTIAYTIVTGVGASADPVYNGFVVADVTVSTTDNDAAGVTVTPTSGLTTTEASGTTTFTMVLTAQPTANVTIPLSSSDLTEGTVSPASVTFTSANWNVAQTVTITGVDDFVVDGTVAYTMVTGATSSSDAVFNAMAVADVSVANTDNDVAGVTVTPISGLMTTEAGGTATFTMVMTSQPVASVTIPLSSTNLAEGTVAPAAVTFTAGNWNVAQTVTATGVDDSIPDGSIAYTIVTGAATSTDPIYSGFTVADVSVTNADDDNLADLALTKTDGISSVYSSATTTYTIDVTNNGPLSATGAVLTDPAVAGLTKTSITCTGGTACPATLSVAALEGTGIVLGTLANQATVTFTIAATVTAPGGSVSNSATVTVPAVYIDPVPGNNSATDTNSVSPRPDIFLQITASTSVIELGDTLSYSVRAENRAGPTLPLTIVTDRLPRGFRYLPGSALMSSDYATSQPIADPMGSPGPVLTFIVPEQLNTDGVILTYRVRVGPGALQSNGINTVEATALNGVILSNAASAAVVVSGGVFTPDACVIGKIFADGNRNHVQDRKELGIPGVHLVFEEGTTLVSDVEGKYSYCGLTPTTHVLKVDRTTLPSGAQLAISSNRNAGDANSLFIDLKYGEVHRADFIEGSRDPRVLAEIVRRRTNGEVWEPSFENVGKAPGLLAGVRGRANQALPVLTLAPQPALLAGSESVALATSGLVADASSGPLEISANPVGVIQLFADRAEAPADGSSLVNLTVHVNDTAGHPASTPIVATLEVTGGRLQEPASGTPVTQLRIENGVGVVQLLAPGETQDVQVRVSVDDASTGAVSADGVVRFVPRMRPFTAVGLFEGMMAYSHSDTPSDSSTAAHEAFDRELQHFAREGDGYIGARGAMFVKGAVFRNYLLTLSFDSDKTDRGVLFRDIQPDAFYPIYGDASLKGFDAQTSGKFYMRAERGHSFLLYGDLQTAQSPTETQNLGLYRRTLTGLQTHVEKRSVVLNIFGSHDSLSQVVDEIAGLGISGPYSVSNTNGVSGTEKIEIVTRDRNQPAVILSTVALTRFTDYEFEPFNGRLLFRRPVPAVDELLNPVSVRVTYEVERGGEKAWIGGVDGHVNFGRFVQAGGSWAEDRTPGAPYRLSSVNGIVKFGKSTILVAEGAQSTGTVNTTTFNQSGLFSLANEQGSVEGTAARVELRHDSRRFAARLFAGTSSPTFNNPASTLTGGRSEFSGRATLAVAKSVRLVGEAIRSEDKLTDGHRDGALLSLQTRITKALGFEFGVRRSKESVNPAQGTSVGTPLFGPQGSSGIGFGFNSGNPNVDPVTGLPIVNPAFSAQLSAGAAPPQTPASLDVFTVKAMATLKLSEMVNFYAEGEQDVRDADKHAAAVGGQYHLTDRTRLYLRHEFLTSMGSAYGLNNRQNSNNTVFGISSTILKNTDAFSEYRLRDAISGREAEAALGLRNLWKLAEGVNLSTSLERLNTFAGVDRQATAASLGFEYTRSPLFKSTERIEWRRDDISESWTSTIGLARKISRDWSVLSKNYYQRTAPLSGSALVQNRFWIGGAYRQTDTNHLNVLSRYEYRYEDGLGLSSGISARRDVHTISTHADWHPVRTWNFSGQYAAKRVTDGTVAPAPFLVHLVSGRVGHDVSKRIDLGLLGSTMWSPEGGGRQSALGAELGYLVRDNMWISVGYNFSGFSDRDLTVSQETSRGVFVRFRLKFDEDLFKEKRR